MRKLRNTLPAALAPGQLAAIEALSPPGIGHNHPPPELEPDDVLWGGQAIHDYVVDLLGIEQSLSATYYQIAKGLIPARKFSGHLIGSKRGIAQTLAIGTGLVS